MLDRKVVEDLIETRLLLEPHTVSVAVRRATAADLEDLERDIRGMKESVSDPERYLEHDLRFHLRIARAMQNRILENLLSTIRGLSASLGRADAVEFYTKRSEVPSHSLLHSAPENPAGANRRRPAESRRAIRDHILT